MTGVRSIAAGVLAVLLGGIASAEIPTVRNASGSVRVGRPGAWRKAAPGASIREDEFLNMEVGSHATVTLGDGAEKIFAGRNVISGRRLATSKDGTERVLLSDQVQKQALAALDYDANESTASAVRGANAGAPGARRRALSFMGEDEEFARGATGEPDLAESRFRLGDPFGAIDHAWGVLADPDAAPVDRCRAHLVMGRIAANDADFDVALREFDLAARPLGAWETRGLDYRAEALVQRGQARMQLGDDGGAVEDFREAIRLSPSGAVAAQGRFFLGVLALAKDDLDGAKRNFAALAPFPELARSAEELLRARAP